MNRMIAPLLIFIPLCLALGFALYKPEAQQATSGNHRMPPIQLHPLSDPAKEVTFTADPGRITILNFFASWCVICVSEHAEWMKLANRHGVSFNGVAWNDTPENVRAWLKKHGDPYDAVWMDRDGDAALTLGLRGVPETYVISGDSIVKLHIRGALTSDSRAKLEALLTTLKREAKHARATQ